MALQSFKETDATEAKVRDCFLPGCNDIGASLDLFYQGAYTAYPLGDVLAATGHPLAGVIPLNVFRTCFPEIHNLFTRPGTFDFYVEVFRKIWGEDVEIEFTIPSPGVLEIEIVALATQLNQAIARHIVDNEYVYENLVDHDGDNLIFQGVQGLQTQRQADALMRELHPAGIWVDTTLEIE